MLKRLSMRFFLLAWVSALLVLGGSAPALAHRSALASFGSVPGRILDGVTVDQSTDDVYLGVLGFGSKTEDVYKFDPSRDLLMPPSPFGVGSEAYSGVAVNPTNGDVDVVDARNQTIGTYDPNTGALLSSFSIAGTANIAGVYTVVQIATDAAGDVYVPNAPSNEVQVFAAGGGAPGGGVAATITGSGAQALSAPTGVAVDPSGDVWVADSGNGRIEEFQSDGTFVKEIASPGVQTVAVDGAGEVFAYASGGATPHVTAYTTAGARVEEFGLGTLAAPQVELPFSIAVDQAHGVVYVVDGGNNVVWPFVLTPEVTTGQASGVQQTSATLQGHVDPAGSGNVTSCEFEYGASASYTQTAPCTPPVPYAAATDPTADLTGLSPSTTYHFRLVAGNASGAERGGDETFTTPGPPVIDSETSTDAITTTAALHAQINPIGQTTACQAQYVDDESFQASGYAGATTLPCNPGSLGAVIGDQSASVALSGLRVGTVYHYRFIASNQAGTTTGTDQTFATFGVSSFSLGVFDQGGQPYTQAGGHPYELRVNVALNTTTVPGGNPNPVDANPKDIRTELPPGLIGNPEATPKCMSYNVAHADCSGATQVGTLTVKTTSSVNRTTTSPLYNLVPPAGLAAQLGARFNGFVTAHIDAKVRTGGNYGITSDALYVSAAEGLVEASVTLWGVPAEAGHDSERYCPRPNAINEEGPCGERAGLVPFLRNPTSCSGALTSHILVDSWQAPGVFTGTGSEMPGVTGCDKPDFSPSITVAPESSSTSSATGLHVDLHVPQNENPSGLAEADLKDAVVTLPEGVTVNPSSANGLGACSPGQIELHGPEPASCPDASKIGKVEILTPLLDRPLDGGVYLATPNDNPFGSLLAIYIAVHDPVSGVVVKLAGHVEADPVTGRLTTRFDDSPQLPFEDLRVDFFGGPRASLVTPEGCGTFTTGTDLTPWTSPEGADAFPSSSFQISQGCGARGFEPAFSEGTVSNQAGAFSPLTLTFSRADGEQHFKGFEETLPQGLLAKLAGVPLCTDAQAATGACPEASRIGTVTALAGVGPDPVSVQGKIYLTGGYDGGAFGEVVEVPAVAGPFNLGVVVVRGSIKINPVTAQASVVSDPFPSILNGIPLLVKTVNVTLDRQGFTFNPTNCRPMSITGALSSTNGTSAPVSSAFQAANCTTLGFKPSFTASTQGKTSKANGASLTVKVKPIVGQANIAKVSLQLPKQLPARLTTLQKACTEKQFDTNPAGCPEASDIGTGKATTPLLNSPLVGPAYLVSHGGAAFPDVEFILQGEGVTIELDGKTQIKKGITYSHFETVPDAPISSFETVLPEGPHSALAANGNLCSTTKTVSVRKRVTVRVHGHSKRVTKTAKEPVPQPLTIPTTITGQNGAVLAQATKVDVTGCPKAKKKAKVKKQVKPHGNDSKGKK